MLILEMSAEKSTPACKLNVILDIDETFVYFIKKNLIAHSWDTLSPGEKAKYVVHTTKEGHVIIERPHLETLLDYLFANCTVSVWTWSDRGYAKDMVKRFLLRGRTDRKIKHIFADKEAHASAGSNYKRNENNENDEDDEEIHENFEPHGNSKDLNYLWYGKKLPCFSECNTILVDDLPGNSLNNSNKQNSITVKPFALFGEVKDRSDPYEDVSDDKTLLEVIDILKKVQRMAADNYKDDDKRWVNIFSPGNVKAAGLQGSLTDLTIKRKTVRAISAGLKKETAGGARRRGTRKQPRRSTRMLRQPRRSTRKQARRSTRKQPRRNMRL